ncbi:MAG: hypothetical protein AAF548_05365 [Actinomycetota bacterium]
MTIRIMFLVLAILVLATGCDWVGASTVASDGTQANNHSVLPAISDDGRVVAYSSIATNLVPNDTNATQDIFVHDHETATTERVSVPASGKQANGASYRSALSDDGRYVVFHSIATNLVADDTNGVADVFRHDRQTGETIRISTPLPEGQANGASTFAAIDGDGDVIAFMSEADNLVAGDTNGVVDVFVRDLGAGTIERVSTDFLDAEVPAPSHYPSVDDAGDLVSFVTAGDLVLADGNGGTDVYVAQRSTGQRWLTTDGDAVDDDLSIPRIAGDGSHLAYVAEDAHFIADSNGVPDVYRVELSGSFSQRIVSYELGGDNDDGGFGPSISDDGREVTFRTTSGLLAADTDGTWDAYAWFIGSDAGDFHNLLLVDMDRVRVDHGNGVPGSSVVSGDGRFVAWATDSDNVFPNDANGVVDIVNRSIATPWDLTADPANPTVAPGTAEVLVFTGTVMDPAADVWIFGAAGVSIDGVAFVDFDTIEVTVSAAPDASPGARTLVVEHPDASWSSAAGSGDLCQLCVVVAP